MESFFMVLAIYFLPTLVAMSRKRQTDSVAVLNLFLGWTLVGWVVALCWAFSEKPKPPQVVYIPAAPLQERVNMLEGPR